jgi:hypothetical protein
MFTVIKQLTFSEQRYLASLIFARSLVNAQGAIREAHLGLWI